MVILIQKWTARKSGTTDLDLHNIYLLEQNCQHGQVQKQQIAPVLSSAVICQ